MVNFFTSLLPLVMTSRSGMSQFGTDTRCRWKRNTLAYFNEVGGAFMQVVDPPEWLWIIGLAAAGSDPVCGPQQRC
jgi:hypothetical protein